MKFVNDTWSQQRSIFSSDDYYGEVFAKFIEGLWEDFEPIFVDFEASGVSSLEELSEKDFETVERVVDGVNEVLEDGLKTRFEEMVKEKPSLAVPSVVHTFLTVTALHHQYGSIVVSCLSSLTQTLFAHVQTLILENQHLRNELGGK